MGKLIYFVDDDKMILNLIEYTFKNRGNYDIKTFRTGEDCLAVMNEKPDLVVLDHLFIIENTKFSSGIEILKKIREIDKEVEIIMLSGEQKEEIIKEYLKNGVSKFITKDSFFIDVLIDTINEIFPQ